MAEVSRQLMRIFAVGLGLDVDYFEDKVDRHISMFRALNYPDQPEAPLDAFRRLLVHQPGRRRRNPAENWKAPRMA